MNGVYEFYLLRIYEIIIVDILSFTSYRQKPFARFRYLFLTKEMGR